MKPRKIRDGVEWVGAVDWNRRLFDSLIPLPDGTSYNAYLVRGSEKTALLDAVDPAMENVLLAHLENEKSIEYVISHHAEQDHSGALPAVLRKYPGATLVCTPKAKGMLCDHLCIEPERIKTVEDGETLSLGNRTLRFIHTPWVHWPETMCTYLEDEKILFSCDFFGSHLAASGLFAGDDPYVFEAAKRYYAEIMMPFRAAVRKDLAKLKDVAIGLIAPSHGPLHNKPQGIMAAYADWVSDRMDNSVVIPYVSMHGSTELMVDRLICALAEKNITAFKFDLAVTDLGKLAMSLVDAATIVIGTPTVHFGPHPVVYSAVHLANALRPKLKHAAIVGSYGWGTKAAEQIAELIPDLKVELLGTIICKGAPKDADFSAIDDLATSIAEKHKALGLIGENW